MSANPTSARARARPAQAAPGTAAYASQLDNQGRWITPIQSYQDRERRTQDYLAQRNVVPETQAPDAGLHATNAWRSVLATRIKAAILDNTAVPEDSKGTEAYKHLFVGVGRSQSPRWSDAEIEDLSWQLVELGEHAALGQCQIPNYHEMQKTSYAQFPSLEARVAAVIEVLLVKKKLVASCFVNKAFAARLMWNPEKVVYGSQINDKGNTKRQQEEQRRRQQERATTQQDASGAEEGENEPEPEPAKKQRRTKATQRQMGGTGNRPGLGVNCGQGSQAALVAPGLAFPTASSTGYHYGQASQVLSQPTPQALIFHTPGAGSNSLGYGHAQASAGYGMQRSNPFMGPDLSQQSTPFLGLPPQPGTYNTAPQNPSIQNERIQNERIQNERIQNERIQNERIQNERIQNERIQQQDQFAIGDWGYESYDNFMDSEKATSRRQAQEEEGEDET
ncbi:hypothetical protein F5Y18DRAFT_425522 [Xylariaceae sp. FL1019]|nr:hypothetical protein F5Y18DRAFT_425522 [Xylariaceae sp. FL1019]